MTPIISILMPTIPQRRHKFYNLKRELFKQQQEVSIINPELGTIEILHDDTKRFLEGGITVGKKRDNLLRRATGIYVCWLDDDDDVSHHYVRTLLELAKTNYDCLTFRSVYKCDTYQCVIEMKVGNPNEDAGPNKIVKRAVWHVCPFKREFAIQYSFPDKNNAEDWDYMKQVQHHFVSSAHTDKVLHYYQHSAKVSEVDNIERKSKKK